MAKSDWKALLVKDPEAAWSSAGKPVVNPAIALRAKAVKSIDGALAQLEGGADAPRQSLWKVKGDMARVTLKVGRNLVSLDGADFAVVPAERAKDFYEMLKASVEAGELDAALATANGSASGTPRAPKASGGGTRTWSDERKKKFAATIAARSKAGK